MGNIVLSGRHSTLTQLARTLIKHLSRYEGVDRVSPGQISSTRSKSQAINVRREGELSMTITVIGGGIQDLFLICDRAEGSFDSVVEQIKVWSQKQGLRYRYYDQRKKD